MSIENRNVKAGAKLVATYKKQDFTCTVKSTKEGLRFVLEDGTEYRSPSSAGSAVMGGASCNGWRFWSMAGEAAKPPKKAPANKRKRGLTIKVVDDQTDAPEGQVRYWCSACMDGFTAPAGVEPLACPKGHANEPVPTAAS
jgi:hypothetical protein